MKSCFHFVYVSLMWLLLCGVPLAAIDEASDKAMPEDVEPSFLLPSGVASSGSGGSGVDGEEGVAGQSSLEEEIFTVMPQFTVSTTRDRGYYSANTLSGTRTNQLIKDTPMTISVVNEDLMEDLNLTEIDSIERVVASVQAEEETFSNNLIRFRGLLTRNQLFEFMQRKLGQDSYNVDRVEVVRGANTLVYGQAAPGGKSNYLAEKATFGDNFTEIKGEIGENSLYRASIDHNMEVSDKIALRLMGTYYTRDYDQRFKSKTLDGQTIAIGLRPTEKTTVNLHFERYFEERVSPRTAYLDRSGEYGFTGILEDLPATPDIVKYLPAAALQYMIDYNDGSLTSNDPSKKNTGRIPQLDINSADDLRLWYQNAGINKNTFGYGSPDLIRDRYGIFFMGDLTHQFTDDLALKIAYAHEEYNGKTQQLATSGDIFLSATSRAYLRDEGQEPNTDADGKNITYDGKDPATMPSPYIIPTWEKSRFNDDTDSVRTTLSWDTEIKGSRQQFILGLDYDRRDSNDKQWQQVLNGTEIAADGSWDSSKYRARDYVLLRDYHNGYTDHQRFNYSTQISPNYNENSVHSTSRTIPGAETNADSFYALRRQREAVVDTKAVWVANQGSYMDGRLNTLLGVRFDHIDLDAVNDQVQIPGQDPVYIDETYTATSPSLGVLYWANKNFGVFANYAKSIESPTGWAMNPVGDTIPPEIGTGFEGGVKFEFLDGKVSGQLNFFDITKENDSLATLGTPQLERLFPYDGVDGIYDNLYGDNGVGFGPIGRNVAGIDTNTSGIELDVYYNPTPNLSLFLGYAFADALYESGPKDPKTGKPLLEKGQRVPGTVQHSANLTARYNFKEGKLKGWFVGSNLKYRSKSYYNRLYTDEGRDERKSKSSSDPRGFKTTDGGVGPDYYDGRPDLFPNVDVNGNVYEGAKTRYFDIWLSDSLETDVFVGWSGRLFNKKKDAPKYKIQLTVANLFDERPLVAKGKNPLYPNGRRATLKASVKF